MALKKRSVLGRELEWNEVDQNWTDIEAALAQKAAINHSHAISNVTGLQTALDSKINTSSRGANNGVASLGNDGKVPLSQLPDMSSAGFVTLPKSPELSNSDIGKCAMLNDDGEVVVWNPEPPTEGSGGEWLFVFDGVTDKTPAAKANLSLAVFSLAPTTDTRVRFNFNSEDSLPMGYVEFVFVTGTPSTPQEVQIGVDGTETGNNFIDVLQAYIDANGLDERVSLDIVTVPGMLLIQCEDFTSFPNNNWSLEASDDAGLNWYNIGTFSGGSGGITEFNTPIGIVTSQMYAEILAEDETITNVDEEAAAFAYYLNSNSGGLLIATDSANTVTVVAAEFTQESFDFSIVNAYPTGIVALNEISEYEPIAANFIGLHVIPRIHQIVGDTVILQVSGVVELTVAEAFEDTLTISDINTGIRAGNPALLYKLCATSDGKVIPAGFLLLSGEVPETAVENIAAYVIGTPLGNVVPGQPVKVLLAPSNFY